MCQADCARHSRESMLTLSLLPETFAVCRLESDHPIPQWAVTSSFFSMTRTFDELSIVCPERNVPEGVRSNSGWKCLKVKGPIDFSAIGVVQSLTQPLANANISIFVMVEERWSVPILQIGGNPKGEALTLSSGNSNTFSTKSRTEFQACALGKIGC